MSNGAGPIMPCRWTLCVVASLFASATAVAGNDADADTSASASYTFDPHIVTTTRLPRSVEQIPYSVAEVSFEDVSKQQAGVSIDESLRRLPGLFVSNRQNLSQGDRLSIRGIGSRTSFGVRGVRLLLDHIR
jgi:iron complex outermembrane receptor protein